MRQIGDFIGGIITLFVLGAILFGVVTSGDRTAIIVIVIIGVIIYIAVRHENSQTKERDKKVKANQRLTETSKISTNDHEHSSYNSDDYEQFDDRCSNCGGFGMEYYCETCYTQPVEEPSTEKYDGDIYCPECAKNGKDRYNIKEHLCYVCSGTGKEPGSK